MTAFEHYFYALKKTLGQADLYDIWPDFEPQYDEQEHAWATLRGLGDVLLLNLLSVTGHRTKDTADAKVALRGESNWLKTHIKRPQDNLNRSGLPSFYVEFMHSNISIYLFLLKRFNIHLMGLY